MMYATAKPIVNDDLWDSFKILLIGTMVYMAHYKSMKRKNEPTYILMYDM